MKFEFLYGKGVLCLPQSALEASRRASASELRILLALSANGGNADKELAVSLGESEESVARALEFWRAAGVIVAAEGDIVPNIAAQEDTAPEVTRNDYTSAEIERICERAPSLKTTIDECQKILGKTFTKTEIASIVYLYDHLRLEGEYIMTLCTYCKSIDKGSVHYIQKTALALYDEGTTSTAALDVYIKNRQKRKSAENKIRTLFGIGARALISKEETILDKWVNDWQTPFELIEFAYEVMISAGKAPTFSYENGILENWRAAGVTTLEEARKYQDEHKGEACKAPKKAGKKAKTPDKSEQSFDLDEFFELAVKRGAGRADGAHE